MFAGLIMKSHNLGMASGWQTLIESIDTEYVILLENDWWCSQTDGTWFLDAVAIIQHDSEVGVVKMRATPDHDHCGSGKEQYAPWTIKPIPTDIVEERDIPDGPSYFYVPSSHTGFSFNPVLVRRRWLSNALASLGHPTPSSSPRISDEDAVDAQWRSQQIYGAAILKPGAFRHTGFYSKYRRIFTLPNYVAREFGLQIATLFVKLTRQT